MASNAQAVQESLKETISSTVKAMKTDRKQAATGPDALKREPSPINVSRSANQESEVDPNIYGWQHPSELDIVEPDWTDNILVYHLIAHAFDVPAKKPKGSPFFEVTTIDGSRTVLPSGYRIPLMFIARFQWLSLKLVLSAENRDKEWKEYKFGILHVSRLCRRLFKVAQDTLGGFDVDVGVKTREKGIDRKWRCPTFDRALARYKLKWFINTQEQLQEFWDTYKNTEYEKDPLKFDWRRWAIKGWKGFSLTEEEIENGIKAEDLMAGLKHHEGKWYWDTPNTPYKSGTPAWDLRYVARNYYRSATPAQRQKPLIEPKVQQAAAKATSTSSKKKSAQAKRPGGELDRERPAKIQRVSSANSSTSNKSSSSAIPSMVPSKSKQDTSAKPSTTKAKSVTSKVTAEDTPGQSEPSKPIPVSASQQSSTRALPIPHVPPSHSSMPATIPGAHIPPATQLPTTGGIANLLGLDLRYFPHQHHISQPGGPSLPVPPPVSTTSKAPSTPPSNPNSNSNVVAPKQGGDVNPELVVRAIEALFGGFTESIRKFTLELQHAKEQGVKEVTDSLKEIVLEEIKEVVKGMSEERVGGELNRILNDLKRSNQRQAEMLAMLKRLKGQGVLDRPAQTNNQAMIHSAHPLEHLLGEPDFDDGELLYPPSPTPEVSAITLSTQSRHIENSIIK